MALEVSALHDMESWHRTETSLHWSWCANLSRRLLFDFHEFLHSRRRKDSHEVSRPSLVQGIGTDELACSSVIIEDLKRTLPKATLLFLYIDSISNKIQSPHAFVLNLLSQVLKQSQDSDPLARDIAQLFVHQPSNLPGDLDAATSALRSELKRCSRVFLVVDALDEYRSGSPEDQTRLVQELESFGVSLLITSRSAVPFTGEHASCEVSATPGDIRRFAGTTLSMGDLQNILKYDPDMKEDVIDELLKCSDGTYGPISQFCQCFVLTSCYLQLSQTKTRALVSRSLQDAGGGEENP